MNFSEANNQNNQTEAIIASLQHWWSLAGVDLDYGDQPEALLQETAEPKPAVTSPPVKSELAVKEATAVYKENRDYPSNFPTFIEWLQKVDNLIELQWSREFAVPMGSVDPEVMILSAMPEAKDQDAVHHFAPQSHQLLRNMMKAIGADLDNCFHTPLALARPIDGQINQQFWGPLVHRAMHLINLVQPKRIILFGDTVSRAFFAEDLLTARKKKQFINHVSSKTEAIVTFHPRILLERPELKAEAWRDLQLLTRIATQ